MRGSLLKQYTKFTQVMSPELTFTASIKSPLLQSPSVLSLVSSLQLIASTQLNIPLPLLTPPSAQNIMSTSTADNLVTKTGIIPRLTHNNYPAWTNAIKFALIGTKGWRIVNGDEEEPEVGITQRSRDAHENYQDRADKALSLIYGSVSQAIQASIAGFTNPRDMWMTLQNRMDIVQNETGSTLNSTMKYTDQMKLEIYTLRT